MSESISLAEICISASSKAWEGEGEILDTGIGLIPRIAAGLAKLTHNPDLMMTDGETYLISSRNYIRKKNYFARVDLFIDMNKNHICYEK